MRRSKFFISRRRWAERTGRRRESWQQRRRTSGKTSLKESKLSWFIKHLKWVSEHILLQSRREDAKEKTSRDLTTNLALWLYASALPAARMRGGAPCCPCTASGEGTAARRTWRRPGRSWRGSASTPPGTSASAASGQAGGSTPGCSSLEAMERRLEREWKQRDFENAQCQAKS